LSEQIYRPTTIKTTDEFMNVSVTVTVSVVGVVEVGVVDTLSIEKQTRI